MQRENEVQHVFLVGAKSLGAYGGYETFVYKLTEYHQNKKNIKYHVACKANGDGCMDETKVDGVTRINDQEFEFHNAHCFKIDIPQIGPAQAIYYDVAALKACCKYIKEHRIKHPIVYIMACRIGPFAGHFYKEIHKLGGTVYLNPDGHEWMRAKWSEPIRKYWKMSEQMMVKYSDLDICDSLEIEKYIHEQYDGKGIKGRDPKTTFIAYGAETRKSVLADDDAKLVEWYEKKGLGLTPDVKTDDIAERTEILETSARKILAAMEETIPDLYSPEGLYIAFVAGWLPVPELWSDSDEFIHAKCWETKMQNGGTHLVDHELLVPLETRINKCIAHNADAEYILKSKYKVLTRV